MRGGSKGGGGSWGVVRLVEKLWPALEHIDTSSGAPGTAVNKVPDALIPIIAKAPADDKTRSKWVTPNTTPNTRFDTGTLTGYDNQTLFVTA